MAYTLPLTYPDLVCINDVDPYAAETTSDLQSLSQDVLHLLLEDLGSNPDDPDRGIGIMRYLSADQNTFATLPATIDSQLGQDPRITGSHSTVAAQADGSYLLSIQISVSTGIVPLNFSITGGGVILI